MRTSITQGKWNKILIRTASLLFWVIVWYVISLLVNQEIYIVSPDKVFLRIGELVFTKDFWYTTGLSVLRILSGFILGIVFGIIFAAVTSKSHVLYNLFHPILSAVKATPVTSFILLAFVWIKTPYIPVFISFLIVLPVIWANVLEGIKNTDVRLLEMSQVMKISKAKVFFKIYVPSVKPYFIAACSVASGMAWKSGIAAEVITHPQFGVGSKMYDTKIYLETGDLFAWTLVVILLNIVFEKIFLYYLRSGRNRRKGGVQNGGQHKGIK